jgi:hypothetical protein
VPADGLARSSGTVTVPHRTPDGHAACARAAVPPPATSTSAQTIPTTAARNVRACRPRKLIVSTARVVSRLDA